MADQPYDADSWRIGQIVGELTTSPITRHTLALYCGASGDHNPIHVDIDYARAAGMPDVFAHGMLVMAYLGRLMTSIAPLERHRRLSSRFRTITHLGDVITCTATLTRVESAGDERHAILALVARNQAREVKVTGEAVVAI